MTIVLKILGIGYLTEFTADIAEDFNNKIVASKVILGGKVAICVMSLPILKELLALLLSLLS
jgi:stage III sporulation protein AD